MIIQGWPHQQIYCNILLKKLSPIIKEALNESILDSSEHARRKCDFHGSVFGELSRTAELAEHLASKSMTYVIDFGGASLCRTESLIQSEIP